MVCAMHYVWLVCGCVGLVGWVALFDERLGVLFY